MDLLDFLKSLNSDTDFISNLNTYNIIVFRAVSYPALFFYNLSILLKNKLSNINQIYTNHVNKSEMDSYFGMSFLGNNIFYFIKDLFLTSDKDALNTWKNFLASYKADHIFGFYMPKSEKVDSLFPASKILVIDIPDIITPELYKQLYYYFYLSQVDNIFLNNLFYSKKNILLEDAFKIMSYNIVLGKRYDNFFKYWIHNIISVDKSLFLLSQYLFANNKAEFFAYWLLLKKDYSPEFWPSFWSDQVSQAINFISAVENNGYFEAKKLSTKLPFSFINKDYKKYKLNFLAKAHDEIYQVDHALKNSVDDYCLELWYFKFLNNIS